MPDLRTQLTELCEQHEVGIELVKGIEIPEQVLDRTLAECERALGAGGTTAPEDLARVRGLVRFARRARDLQRTAGGDTLVDDEQELERLGVELQNAQDEVDKLQRQLGGTLRSMGTEARLEELFNELARLCHKINNPLTAVMGRAQMLQLKLARSGDEATCKTIKVIEESAQRVAAYVQELALVCNRSKTEFTGR